ncbi:MAG: patatin-like phospholipase family protein [Thermoanaerobaculia bacterium]|nr:patatin-like phospholipase family protein [Thermoanaerobaculia bacterium]
MSERTATEKRPKVAIVLTGGGARGAYQVGVLRGMGKLFPNTRFRIVTGVSAGAINAAWLASSPDRLGPSTGALVRHWEGLEVDRIFGADVGSLGANFFRWMVHLASGASRLGPRVRGFLDTAPLRDLLMELIGTPGDADGRLHGVERNLEADLLEAFALTTVNYGTGQTVSWVESREPVGWTLPNRVSREVGLTVDHVLASSALPLLFPAVQLWSAGESGWYGDGGIRLAAPLSPALHLGADRVIAVSTRYDRSAAESGSSAISGYPPPAQIVGNLMNAIFLDVLDQDARRLERLNGLLRKLQPEARNGLRCVDLVLVRPSEDLGALSAQLEPTLPAAFRFFTRSFGTRETKSPDFLSLLMFQPDYISQLMDIGERDALAREDELRRLLDGSDAEVEASALESAASG